MGAGYGDLCDSAHALREGRDFTDQQQLAEAIPGHALGDGGLTSCAVMRLVQMTLRDLQMHERTGQLPGGLPYSRLPAWQVELYRAWWQESQAW